MTRIALNRWLNVTAALLAAGWLGAVVPHAHAQADQRITVQQARTVPLSEDPDDPNASREERIRRSRAQITKAIQQRQQQQAEAAKRAQQGNNAPPPAAGIGRPTPPPPPSANGKPGAQAPAAAAKKDKAAPDISKAAQKHVTLFMTPAAQSVNVGQKFATQWRMLNPDGLAFNNVVFAMTYPAEILKPVAVHQDTLKPLLKGEPEFKVDQANGQILYRATLAQPYSSSELNGLTIEWQAVAPAQQAHIRANVGDIATMARLDEKNLTKTMVGLSDAVTGADVQVLARDKMPDGYRMVTPDLADLQPILAGFPDQSKLKPPVLSFSQPQTGELAAGQWIVVDINMENPDRMVFDELRLAIKFDPRKIEIADTDENNWIHRGVNILDGPFKKNWFWTVQYDNTVDNSRGTIFYRVGTEQLMQQPSGTVARIFARAKAATQMPAFDWIWDPAPGKIMTTGAFLVGDNIYTRGQKSQIAAKMIPGKVYFNEGKVDPSLYRSKDESVSVTPVTEGLTE